MIANVNEKRRQTKLLAAIAIIAMVVCAFAVVMPSEQTDGALSETEASGQLTAAGISASDEIESAGNYYIANTESTVEITFASGLSSGVVNLYIATGTTITVAAPSGDNVHVIPAVAATTTPAAGATVQIYKGLDITAVDTEATYKNTTDASNASINVSSAVATATYGISDAFTNGGSTYYAEGSSIIVNDCAGRTVTVQNGTATVSYGANTVVLDGEMGTDGITATVNNSALEISGDAGTAGTISVTAGSATATNLNIDPDNLSAITKVSFYGAATTDTSGILYSGIPTMSANENLFIYKAITGTIALADGTSNVYVRGTGSYTGTITQGSSNINVQWTSDDAGTITFSNGAITVTGSVSASGTTATGTNLIITGTNTAISASNVAYNGSLANKITVTSGALVIPGSGNITFNTNGNIELADGTSLYIYGTASRGGSSVDTSNAVTVAENGTATIYANNRTMVDAIATISSTGTGLQYVEIDGSITVSDIDEFKAALETSMPIIVNGDIEIESNDTVVIDGKNITFTGGNGILVKEGSTLTIRNSTLDETDSQGNQSDARIVTERYSQLNIEDSLIFMVVSIDEYGGVSVDNTGVTYESSTNDVKVGYGTTLTQNLTPRGDIIVYGTLEIPANNTVTISSGNEMIVRYGGIVNLSGTLNVEGSVEFERGSTGNLAGTVNVRNLSGGATFTSYGDVEVSGTMTVSAPSSTALLENQLTAWSAPGGVVDFEALVTGGEMTSITDATGTWSGFTVTGTLVVDGSFSGIILDKGDVTINGTARATSDFIPNQIIPSIPPIVVLFDGVTLQVNSVTNEMYVVDFGISNDAVYNSDGTARDRVAQSNGNVVVLDDVRGVTVSETVTSGNYTIDGNSYAYYIGDMYIAGTATKANDNSVENITITGLSTEIRTGEHSYRTGAVHVGEGETLTLGEGVFLGNYILSADQTFCIDGTLNITGDGAGYTQSGYVSGMTVGTLTVNGTVVIGPEAANEAGSDTAISSDYILPGDVNGVRYVIQSTTNNVTSSTVYYTDFDYALSQLGSAYNNAMQIYGDVTANTTATISTGQTVTLETTTAGPASLTIADGVTITVADGADVMGSQASIEVKGTLTSANYREDMSVGEIGADVIVTADPARTWTSFANALETTQAPATIELARDITLTGNTTIPEGITVTTAHNLNTSRYTLTVNGTLDILQGGNINITGEPDNGDVVANGVVVMRSLGDSDANVSTLAQFDGAHFQLRSGSTVSNYVTNLAYAAENVTSGTVRVTGSVSAGDVVFTEASNATSPLVIEVATDGDVNTVLSVGSITLEGATFTVDGKSRVTGSILVPYGDGTTDADIELSRAVGDFTIDAYSQATATGTDYTAYLYGAINNGGMTIASGTVDIYHDNNRIVGFTANGTFQVASGATLVVEDAQFTANNGSDGNAYATVDGTIQLDNGTFDGDSIVINGTLDVIENASSAIVMYVTGTVNVGEDATLTVNKKMVVGTAPESLGVGGVLVGDYEITTGYILAYAGADLSGAQINFSTATQESEAETTVYYVNDTEYATAYAAIGNVIQIRDLFGTGTSAEKIELTGLNTDLPTGKAYYDWTDINDTDVGTNSIGYFDAVYVEFDPSNVPGVVTVGAGIDLFIDGVQVSGSAPGDTVGTNFNLPVGTHRVSYEIRAGWDGSSVVFTFNGQTIENNSTITITADMTEFTLSATGAINSTGTSDNTGSSDDGMGLTDYLLIVLVVLIVIMAIMVALRLMRS